MHNADNSGTTGSARRTVGLSGFLVVKTFNSQVSYISFERNLYSLYKETQMFIFYKKQNK